MLNILGLFMPMLSGGEDEYGKDVVPPLPLSVDRVMENRPLKFTATLLWLPYEVLGNILSNVDPDSLGDLALVNSDCRQLARSRQFSSIYFDYSDSTVALIALLLQDKMSRNRSGNTVGAIGPCIRRLTIATNPEFNDRTYMMCLKSYDFGVLEWFSDHSCFIFLNYSMFIHFKILILLFRDGPKVVD